MMMMPRQGSNPGLGCHHTDLLQVLLHLSEDDDDDAPPGFESGSWAAPAATTRIYYRCYCTFR
eukprot:CAMPEP_0206239634 /NCGR_PEP_ID=MMETSP0047_2-20121206/15497_1 /ASSEMBLY_ACC=CAM_ASM_000192 /TAXON_ID=195065 /ORGANISM="Chroomonas mesostigmatica_cf, Strain CCMP1168" /LENGTH=62 /DNA_ID=CAMNT_0053664337 /DNA_START=271 /DNA_END=456 /DNA_ORIENTATION=+